MNSARALVLFLFAASSMAQTPPRPTGPYLEPIPDWQAKAGIESQVVIAPGDDILPQIATSGTPDRRGILHDVPGRQRLDGTGDVPGELLQLGRGPHEDAPGDQSAEDMTGMPAIGFQGILSPGGYGAQVTVQDGSSAVGYAVVTMDPPESVAVNATFVNLVPGKPPFMAGIPLSSALHKTAFMPFLADRGFTPSLALVSLEAQEVTLTARAGTAGAELCSKTLEFDANEHKAFLLREHLFCADGTEGTVEIRGNPLLPASIAGIGFIGHEGGAFVTQPIWTNEEQVTGGVFAPANRDDFDERFLGMRLQTNFRTFYVDFVMSRRFEEARRGQTLEGTYTYYNTGENTARLRMSYDDDDVETCEHQLTFTSGITGTSTVQCMGGGPTEEYTWRLMAIPEME